MGNTTDLSPTIASARGNLLTATTNILTASNTLTLAANAFADVSSKMEQRFKELEEREVNLKALEENVSKRILEVDRREAQCHKREAKVTQREKSMSEREMKWEETEKRMALNASKLPTLIHLNVDGQRFTVPKADLLKHKGSYFESMLMSDHSQQDNGEFFIDRDPLNFKYIRNFIREGKMNNIDRALQHDIEKEFSFFKIPFPAVSDSPLFFSPRIFSKNWGKEEFHAICLLTWLPIKRLDLLYKASRDGFESQDFHKRCDNQGPTLTIIQSNNDFLFGGYSSGPWDSSNTAKNYPNCFLFTLTNPHSIPPTKYLPKPGDANAIYCYGGYGPTFGGVHDIYVSSDSNQNQQSFTNFPCTYQDSTGKGNKTFTGTYKFTTKEVEVYSVI